MDQLPVHFIPPVRKSQKSAELEHPRCMIVPLSVARLPQTSSEERNPLAGHRQSGRSTQAQVPREPNSTNRVPRGFRLRANRRRKDQATSPPEGPSGALLVWKHDNRDLLGREQFADR